MLCPQQPNRNKLYNCFHWQGPDLMIYYSGSCDINITAGIPTRPAWKGDYYVNFQSPSIRLDPSIQHRWPAKFLTIAKQYYIFHCYAMACHHSVLETPFCDLSENCATFHRKKNEQKTMLRVFEVEKIHQNFQTVGWSRRSPRPHWEAGSSHLPQNPGPLAQLWWISGNSCDYGYLTCTRPISNYHKTVNSRYKLR